MQLQAQRAQSQTVATRIKISISKGGWIERRMDPGGWMDAIGTNNAGLTVPTTIGSESVNGNAGVHAPGQLSRA